MQPDQGASNPSRVVDEAGLHDDRSATAYTTTTPTALLDTVFIDSIPFNDNPTTLLEDRLLSRAYFAARSAQCVALRCQHTIKTVNINTGRH